MKFIKLALVFIFIITLTGCDSLPMFQPTRTPRPTVDPALPTNTKWVFSTETPELTVTPGFVMPTFNPPAGWQKIEGDDFEIYLPGSYEGGSTDENVEQIIQNIRNLGGEFKWVADNLEQNKDAYNLIATDTKKGSSGLVTNIAISSEPALPAYSIEAAMTTATAGLSQGFTIVDQDLIEINGNDAGQIVLEFERNNTVVKELVYIIKGESSVWTLEFATGESEYNARLIEFVQIVDSFRMK